MPVIHLKDWPFGPRVLLVLAQARADERRHAVISGIHVASVVLEMTPVRRLIGDADALRPLDAAVERALLLASKSEGKAGNWGGVLRNALGSATPWPTIEVLRAAIGETVLLAKLKPAIDEHGPAIAALLDTPLLGELLTMPCPRDTAKRCPTLFTGIGAAASRRHGTVTTRHVVAAMLRSYENVLAKRGLGGLGDAPARVDAILDREPTAPTTGIKVSPRLVGAVAGAIAQTDFPLPMGLVVESLRGDDEVAFAKDAINDAIRRMAAADGTPIEEEGG